MLIMLGTFQIIEGLVALFDDGFYAVGSNGLVVNVDYNTWGWIHPVIGVVGVLAGLGLLAGNMVARIVGVAVAFLSALVNLAFISAYPVWSTIMITIDVIVIYAIIVHGRELKKDLAVSSADRALGPYLPTAGGHGTAVHRGGTVPPAGAPARGSSAPGDARGAVGSGGGRRPSRSSPAGGDMTADLEQATDLDQMGPVDYLVVAFPTDRMTGEAFPLLVDLVDRGIIRILDLVFLRKDEDGTVTTLTQVDLDRMKVLEAALFDGAASGLLGPTTSPRPPRRSNPGTAAGVLVYENSLGHPVRRRAPPLRRPARGGRPHPGPGPRRGPGRLEAEEKAESTSVPPPAEPAG